MLVRLTLLLRRKVFYNALLVEVHVFNRISKVFLVLHRARLFKVNFVLPEDDLATEVGRRLAVPLHEGLGVDHHFGELFLTC